MKTWRLLFFVTLLFCLVSVGLYYFSVVVEKEPLDEIRVGVLPDESPEVLKKRYQSLLAYLQAKIGKPTRLIVPDSYKALVNQFEAQEIELAYFGGLTFLHAHQSGKAQALVMRDVDAAFSSLFISSPTTNRTFDIESFKNKKFSFGSRFSTSGHLMPRYFLEQMGVEVEDFFQEVSFSGAHDTTVYWVAEKKVDIAAVNAEVFKKMLKDKRVDSGSVQIVWQTPPYVDYVWAVQSYLSEELKTEIRNAFLSLTETNVEHANILDNFGAQFFLPAGNMEFDKLRSIAVAQEML